jgi:choline dehydrogenase-like flavoprotein
MTSAEHLVIGSGAGGALTAAHLAESGHEVLVLEEGPWIDAATIAPFSLDQMARQCRDGGMTVALGRPPIGYLEGRCAGGTTEVNAGLYRLASEERLARWTADYDICDLTTQSLASHARAVESALSVQQLPGAATPASLVLAEGAAELGWPAVELPRCYSYDDDRPVKQSMSRTYLPRALAAGAKLATGVRVDRLRLRRGRVSGARTALGPVTASHVWVCCGAIGTAALLQRSGLRSGIGTTLRVHPMVKLVAQFDETLGAATDVPVHQVQAPDPDISLGGLVSQPSRVALALVDDWKNNAQLAEDWARTAVYYATLRPAGRGHVRAIRGVQAALVSFKLTKCDISRLAGGLADLARLLFAAGAGSVHTGARRGRSIRRSSEADQVGFSVANRTAAIMTLHLFSTAPMGENRAHCSVDSFGRVHGVRGLRVNDASILPDAPGVNPQATLMAIASRNVAAFLGL